MSVFEIRFEVNQAFGLTGIEGTGFPQLLENLEK